MTICRNAQDFSVGLSIISDTAKSEAGVGCCKRQMKTHELWLSEIVSDISSSYIITFLVGILLCGHKPDFWNLSASII